MTSQNRKVDSVAAIDCNWELPAACWNTGKYE